jgi:ferredoxin--NADP+ reductase
LTTADPLAERRAARAAKAPEIPGVPELPEVTQNAATPAAPVIGKVVSNRPCTKGRRAAGFVRHVSIDVSGTPLAGSFRAGQSFGVLPPGEDERGRAHKLRLYSIASPTAGEDGSGAVLATTVKRLIDEHWETHRLYTGVASNYLCDLAEGDEVRVTGPSGKRFLLPADPSKHDYVFVATGTGIAPFRGMLGDLVASGCTSKVTLIMGSPYASDLLYHDDLVKLSEEHDWFTYLTAISRHEQADGAGPMYAEGRLDPANPGGEAVLAQLASERTLVYACGIAGMELGLFRAMRRRLSDEALGQYLTLTDEAPADPGAWERKMIPRQIQPTKRVFLEVY